MFNHNVTRNVAADIAMAPVAAGTGDTQTGIAIDTLGYQSVVFLVYLGTLTASAVTTIKLQHGDAANLSDAADIAGTAISVPQASGGGKGWFSVEIHRPTKRYMRVAVVRATANAVINGAIVLMGRGNSLPPAQGATMANNVPTVLVGPISGTA